MMGEPDFLTVSQLADRGTAFVDKPAPEAVWCSPTRCESRLRETALSKQYFLREISTVDGVSK
jgi:hypothetical protein